MKAEFGTLNVRNIDRSILEGSHQVLPEKASEIT